MPNNSTINNRIEGMAGEEAALVSRVLGGQVTNRVSVNRSRADTRTVVVSASVKQCAGIGPAEARNFF